MIKLIFRLFIYTGIWFVFECALRVEFNYKAEVWAALFIGFEAAFIGLTQLRNTRDTLEVELFMKFNERYSNLNEQIKECLKKDLKGIECFCTDENYKKFKDLRKALEDYINLCCEEYYCYRVKKQVPQRIWKFWHAGIMYNWNNCPCLQELWEQEYSNANSFYIDNGDHPFKPEAISSNTCVITECTEKLANCFY